SATANSLCTPFSSNDVAGKSVPELQGKAGACLPRRIPRRYHNQRRPPQWNNSLLSDVRCHVRSARKEVSVWVDRRQRRRGTARHLIIITSRGAHEDKSIHIDHHRFGCLDANSLTSR